MRDDVAVACALLIELEDRAARQIGLRVHIVRRDLARQLRTSPGTLRNIRKQRRKSVPAFLMEGLVRMTIDNLQAEMRAHEHRIAVLKQKGADTDTIIAALSSQATTRALLKTVVR